MNAHRFTTTLYAQEIDEEFDENALNSLWGAMERPQNA